MLNLVAKRNMFFLVSILLLVPGTISLLVPPRLKPGIEFTSGTTFSFRASAPEVDDDDVRAALDDLGLEAERIQRTGSGEFLIQTKEIEGASSPPPVGPARPSERERIEQALDERFGFLDPEGNETDQFTEFSSVSAAVSREIVQKAAIAVVLASFAIAAYISYAFRNVPNSLRYGVSAVVALLHDVLLVIGIFSILGKVFDTEVNTFFITGLLTVVGFSVHDSIVVFDRIRENVARGTIRSFPDAVNHSLLQTMGRSFNTSLTLVFSILALLLLGGESIRDFLLVLLIGIITGTYSSVFIASMFLVSWQQGDIARLWRRITGRGASRRPAEAVAE